MSTITAINEQRVLNAMGALAQTARGTGINCWTAQETRKAAMVTIPAVTGALASLRDRDRVARTAAGTREPLYRLTQAGRIAVTRLSDCPETCGAVRAGKHEPWCAVEMAVTYAKFLRQYSGHKCTAECDHLADVRYQLTLVCHCGTPCHSEAELEQHRIRHGGRS
jgi:hypothetical protein